MSIPPAGARLLLGPVLWHVGATTATVWVPVLTEGRRAMLDDTEFRWVEEAIGKDAHQAEQVLVGSSLPWLLAPAIHDLESANEQACAGGSALGERIRQALDLEHWAAFQNSFDRLAALLHRVATGSDAPATISVLPGDVHHSYVARADFSGLSDGSAVYQVVSSPVHHGQPPLPTDVRGVIGDEGVHGSRRAGCRGRPAAGCQRSDDH